MATKHPGASHQKEKVITVTRVVGREETIIRRLYGDDLAYEIIVSGSPDDGHIGITGEFHSNGKPNGERSAVVCDLAEIPALIEALQRCARISR